MGSAWSSGFSQGAPFTFEFPSKRPLPIGAVSVFGPPQQAGRGNHSFQPSRRQRRRNPARMLSRSVRRLGLARSPALRATVVGHGERIRRPEGREATGQTSAPHAQLFNADLLTFWFSLLGPFLVEVPKG